MVGFTAIPAVLYAFGCQRRRLPVVRAAAVMAMVGILLNRLNVSIIAFKWYAPVRYVPTWMEVVVTLAVLSAELWVYRWVVERMPVLDFGMAHEERPAPRLLAARPAA